MAKRPTTESASYNGVAKCLHWLIALGIIGMLVLGWYMTSLPKDTEVNRFALFQWHKSIGITILLLAIARLLWRLTHKAPPLPPGMKGWEKFAAHAVHWLFYALIIAMPLTGWMIVSASTMNVPTMYFGLFQWPNLPVTPSRETGHAFGQVHGNLAYLIAGLLVLHVLAAWKHHLFDRDDVLTRMAPKALHPFLNRLRGL